MAQLTPAVIDKQTALQVAQAFVARVEQAGLPVGEAYLYGSYAKGQERPYSDIDIAVVSSSFSGDRFEDWEKIFSLQEGLSLLIEPWPFTPVQFQQDWHPLVHQIKTTGIRIK